MSPAVWHDEVMPDRYSPTLRRRRLGHELKRLRVAAGLSLDDVADMVELSASQLSKMENAQRTVSKAQLDSLLYRYGASESDRSELEKIHKESRSPGWFQPYGVAPSAYVDFESEAVEVQSFDAMLISGLLQTEEYARAVIRAGDPEATRDQVDQRVRVRAQRTELLDEGLRLWSVMGEAALRTLVGGVKVQSRQLDYLLERIELPNVTLQVLPFSAGEHSGLEGPFSTLVFDEPNPNLTFIEHPAGVTWLERPNEVARVRQRWNHLLGTALPPTRTPRVIERIKESLSNENHMAEVEP